MGVYWVPIGGGVPVLVIENLERPNGIVLSRDRQALYVADQRSGEIWSYPVAGPGQLGPRRLLFRGGESEGRGSDGMAVDARGRLYATFDDVLVIEPANGAVVGRIKLAEKPSNCTFGGVDGRTLFVTARKGLYRVGLEVCGADFAKVSIEELSWLAGAWQSASGTEEHWLPPAGGLMLGMHREVRGGGATFEFLRIEARGGDLVLVAQPGGQPGVEFVLAERGPQRAVFVNPEHDFPQRIVYEIESSGALRAAAESCRDGEWQGLSWAWKRAPLQDR